MKRKIFICEISIVILICQKLESAGAMQQKIELPLPYVCTTEIIFFVEPTKLNFSH